jgi:hypothetical protein
VVRKEVVEKEAVEKEVVEKGDNNDNGPICFNHLYQHKNSLFFHIQYMMFDAFSSPNVVKWHRQLNRLIKAAICDP